MLPKLHPLHKSSIDLWRSYMRIANFSAKLESDYAKERLEEIMEPLAEAIKAIDHYKVDWNLKWEEK